MAKNEFKPFAIGEYANVLTQEEYEALPAVGAGFNSGIAKSEQLNKVWRQSTVMAAVLAGFIAEQSGDDVLDDGNLAKIKDSLAKAIFFYSVGKLDVRYIKKSGDTINWLNVSDGLSTGNDLTAGRTLYVNGQNFIIKRGLQDPVNNERQTNGMRIQGNGNLFVDIYHVERMNQYHFFGIHVANGGNEGWFELRNDGSFNASGTVGAGGGDGSKLYPNGDVSGDLWGGYLHNWLNDNINNAQNKAQEWAYKNLVQGVRLSGRTVIPDTGGRIDLPSGCVYTGMSGSNYAPSIWASYSAVQVLINGQWATIGTI
ncbi:hypothetical protein JOE25_004213 [Serratia sp. PL17]|uniref:hypothetical protein n=1 Tax=Serratia sp. PL17 TaxID=2806582 RepID=UPI001B6828BA|nr:hypothetical protein [Serratia sp. PL17]MBP1132607.1 hypothetical protein [Serratia sp. PL17]